METSGVYIYIRTKSGWKQTYTMNIQSVLLPLRHLPTEYIFYVNCGEGESEDDVAV